MQEIIFRSKGNLYLFVYEDFTKDVFSKFDAGRYFIRMEVDWAH
jgi:hypothetical protein